MSTTVALRSLSKRYGSFTAVDDITLDVPEGQLVALLGPSGCGKTTTLRMIGGFVEADAGNILIGGRDVTRLPPAKRNIGFGFQSYALFPHMSIAQNVAFGLEMRRLPRAEIASRVARALDRVRLSAMADRLPKQLSGGQQQRVSLARALVIEPSVLLLDEPLSNLDAQLRGEMKLEIRQIQKAMGITTIFVTHDQDEALSIADRIVVMRAGRIEQDGSPEAVFGAPRSRFVAEFMGVTNLLPGTVEGPGTFRLADGNAIRVPAAVAGRGATVLAIRPERVWITPSGADTEPDTLDAEIEAATYRGLSVEYRLRTTSGLCLTARRATPATGGPAMLEPGARVHVAVPPDACHFVPVEL